MRHHGTVLVCGDAWCLGEDFVEARERWPDAPVIAVNGASGEVPADFLYSRHPERFQDAGFRWLPRQRRRFGTSPTTHAASRRRHPRAARWVDHWWLDTGGGGGSGWGARKLGWLLGFDFVVLCGMPLVAGNYSGHRPGKLMTREDVIGDFRREIEAESEWHSGVVSMSGWTRELLGGPGAAPAS